MTISRTLVLKIFLGVALFIGVIPAISAQYYIHRGISAFERRDFATAEQYFIRSLSFWPTNSLAHAYLGDISYGAKDQEIYYPNRFVPSNPKINYREVIRQYEAALEYEIMNREESRATTVLTRLVMAYRAVKEQDKANQVLIHVIAQYPKKSFMPRYLLASDYFWRANKPIEALELLQPLLHQKLFNNSAPQMQGLYALAARISLHFRDFDNAKQYAAKTINLENGADNPNTELAHIVIAYVLSEKNQMNNAISELGKASAAIGNPHAYDCILARLYLRQQNYSQASTIANRRLAELQTLRNDRPGIGYGCLYTLGWASWYSNNRVTATHYFQRFIEAIATMPEIGATAHRDAAEIQEILISSI